MMKPPRLVTLLPEEEDEPPKKTRAVTGRKLMVQIASVIVLKVATGIAIRNLMNTVREIDILYPEHLDKIKWKENHAEDQEGF